MATRLNKRTVVIVGGGLTAALVARQLTAKGIDVLVLERGGDHRDGADAKLPSQRDELRWDVRGGLVQDWSIETYTVRHSPKEDSLPARRLAAFLPGRRPGRRRQPLERPHLALVGIRPDAAHALRDPLRQAGDPGRHADAGLGHDLRRDGALSRPVREALRPLRQGRQHQGHDPARRQSVRGAAARRLSAAAAGTDRGRARSSRRRARSSATSPSSRRPAIRPAPTPIPTA